MSDLTPEMLGKLMTVLLVCFLLSWFTVGLIITCWPYILMAAALFVLVLVAIAKAYQ